MKKFLFILFLLLAACGQATTEQAAEIENVPPTVVDMAEESTPSEAVAVEPTNTSVPEPTEETDSQPEPESESEPEVTDRPQYPTAATIDEAAAVRDTDWVIGAEDPLVTIIEYGDFQ
ncbi:MAG: hypothetical protein GY796_34020 [Chloroflexi bacterium]|nr:hypothetical protein [Chloroflexota bacterium]